jgi:dihydrodipicolinate synthase/N-acetylneuraminate lyase
MRWGQAGGVRALVVSHPAYAPCSSSAHLVMHAFQLAHAANHPIMGA